MPLYPFTCTDCGKEFEALIARPTADPRAECPSCGGANVAREFGVPAKVSAAAAELPLTNCRGDGPPCGAPWCGRTAAGG
jgi:putative FmdB family regulatory protein